MSRSDPRRFCITFGHMAKRFDLDLYAPYDNRKFWMKEWRRQAPIERHGWRWKQLTAQRRIP